MLAEVKGEKAETIPEEAETMVERAEMAKKVKNVVKMRCLARVEVRRHSFSVSGTCGLYTGQIPAEPKNLSGRKIVLSLYFVLATTLNNPAVGIGRCSTFDGLMIVAH